MEDTLESAGPTTKATAPNTALRESLAPSILIIFGITGDLSRRKLLPALYHLLKQDLLHENTEIVGISRDNIDVKDLLAKAELCIREENNICDPAVIKLLERKLHMYQMDLTKDEHYVQLREHLQGIEDRHGVCMNRLFYMSIPPVVYGPLVKNLGKHGLNGSCKHGRAESRLLIEKPFGYDYKSAVELIGEMAEYFQESQIYRIDHYLAKETVQNILTFRFRNPVFRPLWSREYISKIEIVATETIGIEGRAAFYEPVGALRDLIQSHLLQLLAVTTMDRPSDLNSNEIHEAKLRLLESVQQIPADKLSERAVRGQYDTYKAEVNNPHSVTETFAAIKLFIDDERWQDVPIIIKTGKALSEKKTAIHVCFRHPLDKEHTNTLTFAVQPSEGIAIDLWVKKPGFDRELQTASMDFSYQRTFEDEGHPDAYERVLVDAVRGDRTLFATSDEVLAAWRIIEPAVEAWGKNDEGMQTYKSGSAGPATFPETDTNAAI
ncbi:MAG TPA: glucose-6-phosphate dehydrogenase [Candidatus Saccharimonadales bacterium]